MTMTRISVVLLNDGRAFPIRGRNGGWWLQRSAHRCRRRDGTTVNQSFTVG